MHDGLCPWRIASGPYGRDHLGIGGDVAAFREEFHIWALLFVTAPLFWALVIWLAL